LTKSGLFVITSTRQRK